MGGWLDGSEWFYKGNKDIGSARGALVRGLFLRI